MSSAASLADQMPSPAPAAPPPDARGQDVAVISLVGLAHAISHFSQLLLPPLFPWLKDAFGVGYAELGFLLTIFFVVSCCVQAVSGFLVDRHGPRPLLLAGTGLLGLAALGFAASQSYAMLAFFAVIAGLGNGVFHPVDYTLLNRKIASSRLGHAYSVHGITGTLGWAAAPLLLVPVAMAWSWRAALVLAALLAWSVLALLWVRRDVLAIEPRPAPVRAPGTPQGSKAPAAPVASTAPMVAGTFDFLKLPAVWTCFAFFFCFATVLSVVQSFAPEAARHLHAVPTQWSALCLTVYMVCSAAGMVLGGFLASQPARGARIVAGSFVVAALMALSLGYADVPAWSVPVMFGVMGFASGCAGPSRDLIVKAATPEHASGRVFGIVYSGLDIGQAVAPLVFGRLMDLHQYRSLWLGLAIAQGLLILSAFGVQGMRRQPAVAV